MASETFIGPLLRVSLFQGLTQPQLAGIARRAERVMFRIGQTMIKAGDAGDGAFLLIVGEGGIVSDEQSGSAARESTPRDTTVVETGSLIGEMSMLIDTEYSTTIVAKSAVRALKITRAALYAQMEQDPELAAHFVAKISSRLRDFTDELRRIEAGLEPSRDLDTETAPFIAIPQFSGLTSASATSLQRAS
jgi:CRP-like cAMP-binding protein